MNDNSKFINTILYNIYPLQEIIEKWSKYYSPSKEITLDGTVIPFYRRSKSIVYNPLKPDKWGYKSFKLTYSRTAYCLNFVIYTGSAFT